MALRKTPYSTVAAALVLPLAKACQERALEIAGLTAALREKEAV